MKLLGSIIGKFEILAFIIGFVAGIYIFIFPARYFFTWYSLPVSPEPVDKIIATNLGDVIVRTVSNKKFLCNIVHEEECWIEVDYQPLSMGKTLCEGNCPNTYNLQIMESTVLAHSFVAVSTRYSLNNDGVIRIKQKVVVFPDGYMIGVILGLFCSGVAFAVKYLCFKILKLFQRAGVGVT